MAYGSAMVCTRTRREKTLVKRIRQVRVLKYETNLFSEDEGLCLVQGLPQE